MELNRLKNPVALAEPYANKRFMNNDFKASLQDERDLVFLDYMAEQFDMFKKWFIEAGRVIITPVSFENNKPVKITTFEQGLTFEGNFSCYSRVSVGRIIGGGAVRALCMTFDEATLLPYFDSLGQRDLLHVPILAAKDISSS